MPSRRIPVGHAPRVGHLRRGGPWPNSRWSYGHICLRQSVCRGTRGGIQADGLAIDTAQHTEVHRAGRGPGASLLGRLRRVGPHPVPRGPPPPPAVSGPTPSVVCAPAPGPLVPRCRRAWSAGLLRVGGRRPPPLLSPLRAGARWPLRSGRARPLRAGAAAPPLLALAAPCRCGGRGRSPGRGLWAAPSACAAGSRRFRPRPCGAARRASGRAWGLPCRPCLRAPLPPVGGGAAGGGPCGWRSPPPGVSSGGGSRLASVPLGPRC